MGLKKKAFMKKLMHLLGACIVFVCASCETRGVDCCAMPNENNLALRISSPQGIDLLNPNNENAFVSDNIRLYYKIGDQVTQFYDGADIAFYYAVITPESSGTDSYYITLSMNMATDENATTYIKWNETDTDTIVANYAGKSPKHPVKVWYNGSVIIDESVQTVTEIIKN